MSNQNKQPPRRPDLEVEDVRGAAWDNRPSGGYVNVNLSIRLKDVAQRVQEAKDEARDGERRRDSRGSDREDRSHDNGPRYER